MAQYVAMAGTAVSVLSKFKEGRQARADGAFQAAQLEQNAGQELAAGQRRAIEDRRQARLANSRLQALAGGGGSDPGVVNLAEDIAGAGEYRALTSLYESGERARKDQLGAASARLMGIQRDKAAQMEGIAAALKGGSDIYSRYGGGGPAGGKS
jgi:hypothetical protein